MNKNDLRKELIKIRNNINSKDNKSSIIVNKIIKLKDYRIAKVIALYKALPNEVNIDFLINYSLNCGKIVLLPKIIDDNLIFIKIDNDTKYEKNNYNILEPIYDDKNVYNGIIDLIIVPGLGFDRDYNRIGYGKGYYDRFLNNKDIIKIGVCFNEQVLDNIIAEENDIMMDLVIHNKYKDDVYEFFTVKESCETMKEVQYMEKHPEEYKRYKNVDELMKSLNE